jgi:hypothetical protein
MKANLNDLMNIVQMVKPEQRQRTTLKFVGEMMLFTSDKEKDYYHLDSTNIKSTKVIYGDDKDTIEIELG